eukprot:1118404-Rhodomonas_salina.1
MHVASSILFGRERPHSTHTGNRHFSCLRNAHDSKSRLRTDAERSAAHRAESVAVLEFHTAAARHVPKSEPQPGSKSVRMR